MSMGGLGRMLLAGGLSAEEYDVIRGDIMEENRRGLLLYTPIGCIVFCLLSLLSQVAQGPAADNRWIYLGSCMAMAAIMACANFLARDKASAHPLFVSLLVYVFVFVLYAFSISVSVIHPEYPTVSAIVFLLVTPLLFVDRPIRVMTTTVLAVVAICAASYWVKDSVLAIDDMWNAVTFGAVALVADIFIMRTRLVQLFQARKIAYLSETDTLTGLRNRNSYENKLETYPAMGAKVLVCAYADANGLREMNNNHGHDAGDALLCAIANQMAKRFGKKNTYRIGGDEFVAIIPDGSVDKTRSELQHMQEELAAEGYSVSVGASSANVAHVKMRSLVRSAEKEMYAQKRSHYKNLAKDE